MMGNISNARGDEGGAMCPSVIHPSGTLDNYELTVRIGDNCSEILHN
jgi:hypothetical protein